LPFRSLNADPETGRSIGMIFPIDDIITNVRLGSLDPGQDVFGWYDQAGLAAKRGKLSEI
jgi:hypothetical protein